MKRLAVAVSVAVLLLGAQGVSAEDETPEVQRLKRSIRNLERRVDGNSRALELDKKRRAEEIEALKNRLTESERTSELAHKRHPVHSIYGLSVSGGFTVTAQGVSKIKNDLDQNGQAAISADLVIESPVGTDGTATLVFDMVKGGGFTNLPALLASPNGNAAGPNTDIESFDSDTVHVTEAFYEHGFSNGVVLSIGQMGIPGFIDGNEYANDETSQFLANAFVNNLAIEFGGTDNFYSLGAALSFGFNDDINMKIAAFEGDGDYVDALDSPFMSVELDVAGEIAGRPGNYRFFGWNRQGRPASTAANLADPGDPALLDAANAGLGISIDQVVTDGLGVWLRYGTQREKVAQSARYYSGGVNLSGSVFGRSNDVAGFGYGASTLGSRYKEVVTTADPNLRVGAEHYAELYYNWAVGNAEPGEGFHITSDVQYVSNPGGDKEGTQYAVFGLRLQANF